MELSQLEMMRAALGCRAAASQAENQSQRQTTSGAKSDYEDDARAFRELAWKFDAAARSAREQRRADTAS